MRDLFERVLDFQLLYSPRNTPEMETRGKLVRDVISDELRDWSARWSAAPFEGALDVEGSDGTGRKTFVPWVRIHSPELSPSAQSGWYVVFLFRQDGKGVALSISHGSTRFDGSSFKPRSATEAASLVRWGRELIGTKAAAIGMQPGVDLGSSKKLSRAYESTTAFSKTYARNAIPEDTVLAHDARRAVALLGELYRAQTLGIAPDSASPELTEAVEALERISRPGSTAASSSQGFGLNPTERAAVEKRAMKAAQTWLAANKFVNIRDVHKTQSCDFVAMRSGVDYFIEVKGTTSRLGKIILTANEVALHKGKHPANLLIVVHNIELRGTRAEGGTVHVLDPFVIEDCALVPLSYMCQLP